jgi:HEAT repeat protein
MTALLSSLVGLLFVFLVSIPADPAAAQAPSVDLKTFVTSFYPHGLPYAQAHAYGPQAVPDLAAMLADPSLEPYWVNIVATLGCIEDASAVQPLLDFMKRQQGPIAGSTFRAVLSVLPALGQIAYGGDSAALKIITDFLDPSAYKSYGINFVYSRYHDDALGEILGRMAINALGVSGRPEALALLKQMLNDPTLRLDWLDKVNEAIDLNKKMSSLGPENVFGKEN